MADYDVSWNEAIDLFLDPLLLQFLPEAHADIDWSHGYKILDKELAEIVAGSSSGKRVADALVEVRRKNGEAKWVFIHIEIQSQQVEGLPYRAFVTNYRAHDKSGRRVATLVILGDDRPNWKPTVYLDTLWGTKIEFEFPVIKLLDYRTRTEELEQSDNPIAAVVLAHLETLAAGGDPRRLRTAKVRRIIRLYDRFGKDTIRKLVGIIDRMMNLPNDLEAEVVREVKEFQQEKQMPYVSNFERVFKAELRDEVKKEVRDEMMDEVRKEVMDEMRKEVKDEVREEVRDEVRKQVKEVVRKEAKDEVREEVRDEVRKQAVLEGLEQAVEMTLSARFGNAGLALAPLVKQRGDVELCRALLSRIPAAASVDEVRSIIAPASSLSED